MMQSSGGDCRNAQIRHHTTRVCIASSTLLLHSTWVRVSASQRTFFFLLPASTCWCANPVQHRLDQRCAQDCFSLSHDGIVSQLPVASHRFAFCPGSETRSVVLMNAVAMERFTCGLLFITGYFPWRPVVSLLRGVVNAINIIVIAFLCACLSGWLKNIRNPLSACLSARVCCAVTYPSMKQTMTEFTVKGCQANPLEAYTKSLGCATTPL